ncbi:hypothetical protein FRC00_001641 [Tulasnella sp. 408]|nr:hypothetical protein FRC00_001641 [Tulasnella sp. 408]
MEEWATRARQFFVDQHFLKAALCFTKAILDWWARVARAYHERQAVIWLLKNGQQPGPGLANLARIFDDLARSVEFQDEGRNSRVMFAHAAELYVTVPDHKAAADAFLNAEKYAEAARHYHKAGLLDRAWEIATEYHVEQEIPEATIYAAKIVYAKGGDVASLHKARKLCKSKEEFLELLDDHGFEKQKILFLESVGDYADAGRLLLERGDYISALLQLCQIKAPISEPKASLFLLEALRVQVPLGAVFAQLPQPLLQNFSLSQDADLSDRQRAEVDLLYAMATSDYEELEAHGLQWHKSGDHREVILALDSWAGFNGISALGSGSDTRVVEALTLYFALADSISALAGSPRAMDNPSLRKLFAILAREKSEYNDEEDMIVNPNSIIYSQVLAFHHQKWDNATSKYERHPVTAPKHVIEELIRTTLLLKLESIIDSVVTIARSSRAFDLCSPFASGGGCPEADEGCCRRDHIKAEEFTIQKFNMKVRLIFLLIRVLNLAPVSGPTSDLEGSHAVKRYVMWESTYKLLIYLG